MQRKALKVATTAASGAPAGAIRAVKGAKSLIAHIMDRQTSELVVAFCGPIGSGATKVSEVLRKCFSSYNYKTSYIKLSNIIIANSNISEEIASGNLSPAERIDLLQTAGNKLREEHGGDILIQLAIKEILINRKKWLSERDDTKDAKKRDAVDYRHITIIDSLKNPEEFRLLQTVYGEMFYLFGVLCPESYRLERLVTVKRMKKVDARRLIERDKQESFTHGQQLIKTIQHADFFINNPHEREDVIEPKIQRFVKLILGDNKFSPTIHEYGMFLAQSAAMRSACLSRQVGAAIISSKGDIVATGRNDVPRYNGGIYTEDDGAKDNRCVHKGVCASDLEKDEIKKEIKQAIIKKIAPAITVEVPAGIQEKIFDGIFSAIESYGRLQGLIEFSRAVHAEMDAITTAAKNGGPGICGASLYCTTFPCHHCARHIVAVGIKRVYYIEPYEKSLALLLHGDSMTPEIGDDLAKLQIIPFEGVAPKKYLELFAATERKAKGHRLDIDLTTARPAIKKMLDPYIDYESRVVEMIDEAISLKK